MKNNNKAIVLSSGGLDSTTVFALAKNKGFNVYSLSFAYGQRHIFELKAAEKVAKVLKAVEHLVVNIDLGKIGGSALTGGLEVPKNRNMKKTEQEIPVTYVPARNTIFLSCALAWAEIIRTDDIFIGVNALDYSGYPDCRPEYIDAFEKMANLATKTGVEGKTKIRIRAPLIRMTKAEIIKLGTALGVDYSLTHSCYDPSSKGISCGHCDSCVLRQKGFSEAGIKDPLTYA